MDVKQHESKKEKKGIAHCDQANVGGLREWGSVKKIHLYCTITNIEFGPKGVGVGVEESSPGSHLPPPPS